MLLKETPRVYYLGDIFSYHHLAARSCFPGGFRLSGTRSFDEILENIRHDADARAVIAVENSIAGEVQDNFLRIANADVWISGECYLQIHLHLGGLQGSTFEDITEVHTHPMAWKEASVFFSRHPEIHFYEAPSTAGGIRTVARKKLRGAGAIGSSDAIKHFGLVMLRRSIENTSNHTRFLILQKMQSQITPAIEKASVLLQCEGTPGEIHDHNGEGDMLRILRIKELDKGRKYIELACKDAENMRTVLRNKFGKTCAIKTIGFYKKGIVAEDI